MTPATIHAPKRKTPTLAFFAAISLLVSPVAITTASAHGGDEGLVHACVGRDKLVRTVGPSKKCKQFGKAIHWEIAEPNSLSGLTVVDATGRPVGQTVEVEASEVTVLLTVGGREVELEVSPNGFTDVEGVSGFSETRDLGILVSNLSDGVSPFIYPDSLDCSSTRHLRKNSFPATFTPYAYASVSSEYNEEGILVARNLIFADPQTPRVLSEGAVYSRFVDESNACVQLTIQPGDAEVQLIPVQLLGDLNSFGFVVPFRLQ